MRYKLRDFFKSRRAEGEDEYVVEEASAKPIGYFNLELNDKTNLLIETERINACEGCLKEANDFFFFVTAAKSACVLKPILDGVGLGEQPFVRCIEPMVMVSNPLFVNQAIAVELYIKALLMSKKLSKRRIDKLKTHDIKKLFSMLNSAEQKAIRKRFNQNGGREQGKRFEVLLGQISSVFVHLRYAYEMHGYAVKAESLETLMFTLWEYVNSVLGGLTVASPLNGNETDEKI